MRAQLRTYHAIPSLQAYQDQNSELEDEPRLKSMLKGSERLKSMLNRASKDRPEPNTLENIKVKDIPRTNPVNLIFVLAQFASKVTELHFPPNRDFYDLIMKEDMSSVSRARAFLWLMWFYLESDFTEEGAEENPFGPGVDYDVDVRNQGVPRFDYLTKEEEEAENVDTPEEKEYGFAKMRERKRIIEADQVAFQAEHGPPKRVAKPMLHLPPDDGGPIRIRIALNTGKGRSGPPTTHQLAVERNRNQRVDYTLSRGLRKKHHYARKQRKQEGAFWRALQRTKQMVDPFDDSEGDGELLPAPAPFKARGFGGLVQLESEDDDFGEEMSAYAAAFRRTGRRLDRWDGSKYPNLGVMGTKRASKTNPATVNCHDAVRDADETEDERPPEGNKLRANGDAHMEDDEDLDDMASEVEEDRDTDEDLDDVELLDLGGDEAEEDISDGRMDVD
jgi:Ino eighty subunit 1